MRAATGSSGAPRRRGDSAGRAAYNARMALPLPSRDDLRALLEWQLAMGVDVALEEEPQDRFAADAARAQR
ncbi:hypothetical protein ACIKT0_19165, partial [Hansschlegelia beijingensis]